MKLHTLLAAPLLALAALAHAAPITLKDDRGASITLPGVPQRIVSLLPSLTETVCELGDCAKLVGVDRFSNFPERAQKLPKLGGLEDTAVEALVALKPDVVLLGVSARIIDRLESLGLKVIALEPKRMKLVTD